MLININYSYLHLISSINQKTLQQIDEFGSNGTNRIQFILK